MKFRGFLKKGNIKRRSNEFTISDPGSDDSWDLLCKDDNQIGVFLSPKAKPSEAPHSASKASTSKAEEVVPHVEETVQRNNVVDETADEIKTANESKTKTTQTKRVLLPFTSTPFVRHKQVPVFEVSSIISPVDDSLNGRPEKEAQNHSGTILVLNRKNSAGSADDTFNQLLNPGKSIKNKPKSLLGIKPLKTLINQGDTTRQYGGAAVLGKAARSVSPTCNCDEDSWETTEATGTATGEMKKTSISPSKMSKKSQEPSSESQAGSRDKAMTNSHHPSDRTSLQDENKAQGVVCEENRSSPKRISRRGQSVFAEIPDAQTKDEQGDPNPTMKTKHESQKDRETIYRNQKEPGGKVSQIQETNKVTVQDGTVGKKVQRRVEATLDHTNNKTTLKTPATPEKNVQIETVRKSIISRKSEHGLKKRVSFFQAPEQTNHPEESVALGAKSSSTFAKEPEAKNQETEMQTSQGEKKETQPRKSGSKQEKTTPREDNISTDHGSVKQDKPLNCDLVDKHLNKQETLLPKNSSGLPDKGVNMVWQSNFAVQIGSTVLSQTSCFGMAVNWQKDKSNETDKGASHHITPPCIANEVSDKANIAEPVLPETSSNTKTCAAKETTVNEVPSSTLLSSPIQPNKPCEAESSSEEERILLRAQSLKLRENQINSSRNSNSLKITDSGQLRMNTSHSKTASSPSKSPIKSPARENHPRIPVSPIEVRKTSENQGATACEQPQFLTPDTLNKSDCLNGTASSCDVFISRQPNDCQSNFEDNFEDHFEDNFENNFELEIMSSSEEEYATKKRPKQQISSPKTDLIRSYKSYLENEDRLSKKPSGKASRLSLKTREIRRRRKEEIEETRRSLGNSSGSDTPSPRPVQKRMMRRGKSTPPSSARDVEDIEKCRKKLLEDDIVAEEPIPETVVEILPSEPSAKETVKRNSKEKSNQKMKRKKTSKEDDIVGVKPNPETIVEILPSEPPAKETVKQSSKEKSNQKMKRKNTSKEDGIVGEKPNPETIVQILPSEPLSKETVKQHSKEKSHTKVKRKYAAKDRKEAKTAKDLSVELLETEPVSSQEVLQTQDLKNHKMVTDIESDHEDSISQEEREYENIITGRRADTEMASGPRCSHRVRKPPSMYWLGTRGHDNAINYHPTESQERATDQLQKQSSQTGRKQNRFKGQKRKIDKTSKLYTVSKKVRQTEQIPTSSQADTLPHHSDAEEVLIHEAYNVRENTTCMPLKVKTTELVWGSGMKGDLLYLGPGAKCEEQKSNAFNQVFYVLEGKINHTCAQDEKMLTTGSVFIVPRGETYAITNLEESTAKLFVTRCPV